MPPSTTRARRGRKPVQYPGSTTEPVDNSDGAPPAEAQESKTIPPEGNVAPQLPALRPSVPTDAAGTYALAVMDDDEFAQRLEILKRGRDRIAQIQRELMELDVDYGLIPGTPKPTLFKPGAEKLALIYGLAARVETSFTPGDSDKTPPLLYDAECFLHLGSFEGPIVAVGHGTASSWEKRYRREADKQCPNCGKTAIIKGKAEYGGGWLCFKKKGGCGSRYADDDERITTQATSGTGDAVGAYDLGNTLLKMAEKRAFVDAVLRATASSSLFTQDLAEEPVVDTPGGHVVDTSTGEVVSVTGNPEEDHAAADEVPVDEVRTADLGEVQRGGHRPEVTTAQIKQVRDYSKGLHLGPYKLADEIADVFGGGLDSTMLEDDPKAAAQQVMTFLKDMHPDDIGKLIQHLKRKATAG